MSSRICEIKRNNKSKRARMIHLHSYDHIDYIMWVKATHNDLPILMPRRKGMVIVDFNTWGVTIDMKDIYFTYADSKKRIAKNKIPMDVYE